MYMCKIMWLITTVVLCLTLLQVPPTSSSDVRYASVIETDDSHSTVTFDFERFKRDKSNETIITDDHVYYTSQYYPADSPNASSLWQDLATMADDNVMEDNFTIESELSGLHRYYQVHDLKFGFPFYGHILTQIAVTTGGFLYTGDVFHEFVAATQFIAPLQADFNPNISDSARVLVWSADDQFTVQWDMVHNHDHFDAGPFTFQVSIFPSGEIHFVYQEIPLPLNMIDNEDHPVEVGVSDAFYIIDGDILRIYEYHRISLNDSQELANSAYILTPVTNCITADSCEECVNISNTSVFVCSWCGKLDLCSDGLDRYRQLWFESGCTQEPTSTCPPSSSSSSTLPVSATLQPTSTGTPSSSSSSSTLPVSVKAGIAVGVIVIVILAVLSLLIVAVILYGYRTPTSTLGQFMIKYRPKARSLNKDSSTSYNVSYEKVPLDEDS